MQDSKLYSSLAFAGTLPFIACALLPLSGIDSIPPLGNLDAVASAYGLTIVCFLAGAHWGVHLSGLSAGSLNLFVTSNAIFVAVWFAFVGAGIAWAIAVQIIAFLLLLQIDFRLYKNGRISLHYLRIRSIATVIAVISLLVILLVR
jgi:hypothetical protein